jgi:hypothetical protein
MESIPETLESLLLPLAGDGLEEDKNSKKTRHSSGQVIRLLLDAERTAQGYRRAKVVVGPSRTEQAYIAAVVALTCDKMEQASEAILLSELIRSHNAKEATLKELHDAIAKDPDLKGADLFDSFQVSHLYTLLRYFRPELDHANEEERIALLGRAIGYVKNYLEALRRLTEFLQYGEAGPYEGLATKPLTQAAKQVRAAELRELVRTKAGTPLPYGKIGKLLGEKRKPTQAARSYDRRIKRMVDAGKEILKQALGEQVYRDYMESKRAEIEHWQTLSEDEQREIQLAENLGASPGDIYTTLDARP